MASNRSAQARQHNLPDVLSLSLLLLGFGLRVYHLGYQSFWYDEGFSVYLAGQGLSAITTGDLVPPLYHYVLYCWILVAGRSEFAVRFLSLACGVLLLPLAYRLTARYFDRVSARIALLVTAVGPYHISYSQEARMYSLVTLLGLLSMMSFFEACVIQQSHRTRWGWVIYALTTGAALYTHYFAFILLAAQGAYGLWIAFRQRERRALRDWTGVIAILAVLYLPWIPVMLDHIRQQIASYWPGVISFEFFTTRTLYAFTTGQLLEGQTAQTIEAGYALLLLVGICSVIKNEWSNFETQIQNPGFLLLLYLLIPFALTYFMVYKWAKFSPRYLLIVWPAFALLVARGLRTCLPPEGMMARGHGDTGARGFSFPHRVSVSPRLRVPLYPARSMLAAVALVFVLGSSAQAADNLYHNPRYAKDDYRALAAYLSSHVQPDEVVLLLSGHIFPVFSYYYPREDWYPIPSHTSPSPPVDNPLTFEIVGELNKITAGRSGVWVVLWQDEVVDPNGVLLTLLDWNYHTQRIKSRFHGLGLRHYRILPGERLPDPLPWEPAPELSLAGEIALHSFILGTHPARAGDKIEIILNWQTLARPSTIYKRSLRLIDAHGQTVAADDARLAGFWYSSNRWKPGEFVAARHILPVPADIPPGDYQLALIVYREDDPQELGRVMLSPMTVIGPE